MDGNVLGLSTLRKKEEKPRDKNSDGSKKLQAFLDAQYGSTTVKKKKKKKKFVSSQGLAIVDADIDTSHLPQVHFPAEVEDEEDAPIVVNAGEFQRIQLQEQRQRELLQKYANNNDIDSDVSPPRRQRHDSDVDSDGDVSPPRRQRHDSDVESDGDVSPPRRERYDSDVDSDGDVSPPRRQRHDSDVESDRDASPPRRQTYDSDVDSDGDVSPPRRQESREEPTNGSQGVARMSDGTLAGIISGKDLKREMEAKRQKERENFNRLEDDVTGKNAGTVYRSEDGRAMSKEEYLESLKRKNEKEKKFIQGSEIPWGKGLRQTKDFQETVPSSSSVPSRWDDPMAHVLQRKQHATLQDTQSGSLLDLYQKELRKAGFNVPLKVPQHSWLRRNMGAPPNRYGIKPGRHWDGVDRSNGFESQLFKRQAELKQREVAAHYMAQEDM